MFSAEPSAKSKFEAAVIIANFGSNGPERANRAETDVNAARPAWRIYDNQQQEVGLNDKVRIRGFMIRDCVVKVEEIEKL